MKKWLNTIFPIMLLLIAMGGIYSWSIFIVPLMNHLSLNADEVQIPFAITVGSVALSSAIGTVILKRQFAAWMILGTILFLTGIFLSYVASEVGSFALLCLGFGLFAGSGCGISFTASAKMIHQLFDRDTSEITWLTIAGFGISMLLTVPIVLCAVSDGDVAAGFLAIFKLYTVISIIAFCFIREPPEPEVTIEDNNFRILPTLKNKTFQQIWFMFFCITSCGVAIISTAFEIIRRAELSGTTLIILTSAIGFANGIGRMLFPKWSNKLYSRCHIFYAIFALSVMVVAYGMFFERTMFIGVLVIIACYGAGISCLPTLISDKFGMLHASKICALAFTAWAAGGIFGSLFIAFVWVYTVSYSFVMWTMFLIYVLGWMSCAAINRKSLFTPFRISDPLSGKSGRITRIGNTTRQVLARIRERDASKKKSESP